MDELMFLPLKLDNLTHGIKLFTRDQSEIVKGLTYLDSDKRDACSFLRHSIWLNKSLNSRVASQSTEAFPLFCWVSSTQENFCHK